MSCTCGYGGVGCCSGSMPGGGFTPVSAVQLGATIAQSLIPVVDNIRDLQTRFGIRTYEVRLVTIAWSAGQRGKGTASVRKSEPILPTPKVTDLSSLERMVQPIGTDEFGSIRVSEISGRYTEDQLRGTPGPDESFLWEVQQFFNDGKPGPARRFTLKKSPMYMAGKLEWQVELERAREDRQRSGRIPPP